jgi:putative endonuclease
VDGFAEKYNVFKLVYFEVYDDINTAIEREKKIKGWVKSKKMKLIRKNNPGLDDLTEIIVD